MRRWIRTERLNGFCGNSMHLFEFIDSREQAKRSPERSPNVAGSKRPVERLRAAGEKSLTVNFGVCFKPTLRLRDGDESRAPGITPARFDFVWAGRSKAKTCGGRFAMNRPPGRRSMTFLPLLSCRHSMPVDKYWVSRSTETRTASFYLRRQAQ